MRFIWDITKSIGFLEAKQRIYDYDYFLKYERYSITERGEKITKSRIEFVNKWVKDDLLIDVGVGSGHFVEKRFNTFGYDISDTAIKRLKAAGKYIDIYECGDRAVFKAYSFFDSFEHINDHEFLFHNMLHVDYIFMSIPIFRDVNHALNSKHFRPDEHYWYFTTHGLIKYMCEYGFVCIDIDNFEIRLGREDILSFAFKKEKYVTR